MKINVRPVMRHYVSGEVFSQAPFTLGTQYRFQDIPPTSFENARGAQSKPTQTIDAAQQILFLEMFRRNPRANSIIMIGDSLDSAKTGRYFAVWLADQINNVCVDAEPFVVTVRDDEIDEQTGLFSFPEQKREVQRPTSCLVLLMGSTMTRVQMLKVQDLAAKWQGIPVIIQCSGKNPVEIAHTLHIPLHQAYYLGPCNETQAVV